MIYPQQLHLLNFYYLQMMLNVIKLFIMYPIFTSFNLTWTHLPTEVKLTIHIFLDYPDFGTLFPSLTFPSLPLTQSLPPIDTIKRKLISFLWSHFLFNFDSNINCTLCPCCRCAKLPHTLNYTKL